MGAPAGLSWQDCEILLGERGKPYLEVSGTVLAESKRQGITTWHLSLSHDGNIATAFVIAEKLNVPESLVIDAIEFELKQNETNERKWWD